MKSLLAAALLIVRFQGLPPLVGPLVPDSGGSITGVVRRADSGQPIPEAHVAVVAEGQAVDQAPASPIITDVNGRFTIRSIQPGAYTVVVQAEGYFGATGEVDGSATRTARTVQIAEGQQSDVGVLKMVAGSTISGRISGTDGHPVAGATVEALRASYIRGRLAFTPVKSVKTDDLGEYRLFWLPPGAYYVRGVFRSNADAGRERYARVFFPGIPEEDAAPPILVRSAAEMSGIDIRIPVTPITGVTISGQVTAEEPDADMRVTSIHVVPRDRRVLLVDDTVDKFENLAPDTSLGRFEIRNVPPGEYNMVLVTRYRGRIRPVSVPMDVDNRDTNIVTTLRPAFDLSGRVTLDTDSPGAAVLKDSIQLVPTEAMPGMDSFAISPNPQTGEFTVPALPVGKYAIQLGSPFRSPDTYLANVKRGDDAVFDSGLTIGGNLREPLEVMLKSRGGILSGVVTDPTRLRPFAYATVVLVPEKTRRQNFALYKHALAGEDGSFVFTGIPPGDYKLFAWASITAGAWENAIFLQRFEPRATDVSVVDDTPKRVELTVIP
jgi:protocatechuate 3,4-dioxygenase beta subunit